MLRLIEIGTTLSIKELREVSRPMPTQGEKPPTMADTRGTALAAQDRTEDESPLPRQGQTLAIH